MSRAKKGQSQAKKGQSQTIEAINNNQNQVLYVATESQ